MTESLYERLSKERKELQLEGKLPNWFTTGSYQMFKENYMHNPDGFIAQIKQIAEHMASFAPSFIEEVNPYYKRITENYGYNWKDCFYNLMAKGYLAPSSPVLANGGTERGSPVSCSGQSVEDSIDGFFSARHEAALLTKEGFGTSAYLGGIRPRGSPISKGGKAEGTIPVLRGFTQDAKDVSQAGIRRGSWAGYIEIDHNDFDEWADYLHKNPQGLNIGWNITKNFIDKCEKGDVESIRRFKKALWVKMQTGKGYFWKVDHVNEQQPACYKDKDLSNKASNLCTEIVLHADNEHTYTCQPSFAYLIKKDKGLVQMQDVSPGDQIWSKEGWTTVKNKISTGEKKVYEYRTTSGIFVGTTDHRVVENGSKVKVGDASAIDFCKSPSPTDKKEPFDYRYVVEGLAIGDGTIRNGKPVLCVGEKDVDYFSDTELLNHISTDGWKYMYPITCKLYSDISVKTYERDFDLHLLDTDNKKRSFLRGIFSANGSAVKQSDGGAVIVLTQASYTLIKKIQMLMLSMGYSARLYKTKGVKDSEFKNGTYNCKDRFDLKLLKSSETHHFVANIGFLQGYKNEIILSTPIKNEKTRTLTSRIRNSDFIGEHEVFHIEVDNESHTYWTGGCNVSNCVLSSMNLFYFDEWKNTGAAFVGLVFLDCVAQSFIERCKNIKGLERAISYTEKARSLGLGTLGLHSYFQKNMLPFDSFEAHQKNTEIFKHLDVETLEASKWMAKNWGEPEWCKDYGIRNTHRLSIAPNMSSAVIAGQVSQGIEPLFANVFMQGTATGEMQRINPQFLKLMEQKGKYNKATIRSIIDKNGSVQHLDWLSDLEKEVFKTAFEIDQRAIIRLASTRQRYIDQGQSLNLFFAAEEEEEYIAQIHKEALLDKWIKGLYYVRTLAGVQSAKEECKACEG